MPAMPSIAFFTLAGTLLLASDPQRPPGAEPRAPGTVPRAGAGYCLQFDGVDDLVHVLRSPSLEPGEITVELWARLDGPQDWNSRLLRKCGHWADGYYMSADADLDQRMQLMVSKSPPLLQVKDPQTHTAYVGAWHHFVGVYASDHAEFWVDGALVAQTTHALGQMTHLPLTDLYIGAGLPSTAPNEYFSGRIDEVRVWDRPRTHAQIQGAWNKSLSGNEPGLVGYWRFDEGAGQVAQDSSPAGNDGELGLSAAAEPSDPVWVVSDAPLGTGNVAGHCLAFDDVDDLVHVLRSPSLEPDEITIELWARLDGPQDLNSRLLRKGFEDSYFITADAAYDQRMQLLIGDCCPNSILVQAKDPQPHTAYIGTWHHFAGVYATDHAEFWVDGVQVANVSHNLGALSHLPLTDLYIGAGLPALGPYEYFGGRIDEVRVWDHPRTDEELQAWWNVTLTGAEPGLVGYWRFDEGAGQVALDSSPEGNHGELGLSAAAESSDPTWVVSDAPLQADSCGLVLYTCSPAAPNSVSATGAALTVRGCASHAVNDLVLSVVDLPPQRPGLLFYGPYPTYVSFGNGWVCAGGPITRVVPALTSSASGTVLQPIDLTQPPFNAGPGQLLPGSTCYLQFWYRDPGGGLSTFNLSNAARITFAP